jgi:hypothetical protein
MTAAKFTPSWKCVAAEFGEGKNAGLVALWMRMDNPSISKADANLVEAAQDMYAALKDAEWANNGACPQCGMSYRNQEHQPKCILANAIAKADGQVQP